mgnify:FL=1
MPSPFPALVALLSALLAAPAWALTLAEAMERAAENTEAGALLRAETERSEALSRAARAGYLPRLSASATLTRNDTEIRLGDRVTTQLYDASAALTASADLFRAQVVGQARSATREVDVQRARARAERGALRHAAAEAYLRALAAGRNVEAAREARRSASETLAEAAAREATGFGVRADVARARLALIEAQTAEEDASAALEDALLALGYLTGHEEVRLETLDLPSTLPWEAGAAAPERPALLVSLDAQRQLSEARLGAQWLDFFPSAALQGQMHFGRSSLRAPEGRWWALTLQLSWVLFDGARYGRLDAARAEVALSDLRIAQEERRTSHERQRRARALRRALAQELLADEAIEVAEENRRLAAERLAAGVVTALDLTLAEEALFRARVRRSLATLDRQLADLALAYLEGRLDAPFAPSPSPPQR